MAKTRKTVKIPTSHWSRHFDRMMFLTDPEVILLKGHLLVEQHLYFAAAIRLRIRNDADIPAIPFGTLIDIVFAGINPERRKKVVWFNSLRNELAHEFDALESHSFAAAVKLFGAVWPNTSAERAGLLKCLTDYVCKIVFRHAQDHQLGPAPPVTEAKVKDFMKILAMAREVEQEIVELENSIAAGVIPQAYINPQPIKE
jgi:hypothetical protein